MSALRKEECSLQFNFNLVTTVATVTGGAQYGYWQDHPLVVVEDPGEREGESEGDGEVPPQTPPEGEGKARHPVGGCDRVDADIVTDPGRSFRQR